jgi:uncharacterized protein YbaR (Trm112 family)
MPKTWTKNEIVELMLQSVREVGLQCAQLGQAYRIEDAIEQVYDDLNEQGLIENEP